jgi:hypothetical protein
MLAMVMLPSKDNRNEPSRISSIASMFAVAATP